VTVISQTHSHRRRNMLTGEWVLVSPQRTQRPWQGQLEEVPVETRPAYDPGCYLCAGNVRANGKHNPDYSGPFAFDNDFPALSAETNMDPGEENLFQSDAETGCCRVVCFSEQHNLPLADMPVDDIAKALGFLAREFRQLDAQADISYVQVFENRGQMMGCSNPHPHAQIWATSSIPNEPNKELLNQQAYLEKHGRSLLLDYLGAELKDGSRLVCSNSEAVSMVPYWATWPFETLLMPRRAMAAPDEMTPQELLGFAAVLKTTLQACDLLFSTSTPYSMGFHPRPSDGLEHPEWQFHLHIYPPLLRSASIRKHMVGFEMLGMPQRDLTPETAAERLRSKVPVE
jgi:UDPglucose--hexose-1-phosphate uridylyltransferase